MNRSSPNHVIPGRDEVTSPESIGPHMCGEMDSGLAAYAAPRNDGINE